LLADADFAKVNEIMATYFQPYPARATYQVVARQRRGWKSTRYLR
jgi:hypothetical protein